MAEAGVSRRQLDEMMKNGGHAWMVSEIDLIEMKTKPQPYSS